MAQPRCSPERVQETYDVLPGRLRFSQADLALHLFRADDALERVPVVIFQHRRVESGGFCPDDVPWRDGRTSRRLRKKIGMLFAHLKRILELDRRAR